MPQGLSLYKDILKPAIGWIAAALLLVVTLPLQLFVAAVLLFLNRGNVFFSQRRIGYKEKIFTIYKFKTLRDIYDANGILLPDIERQTFFGNVLRHLHIDELPQLWNVVLGELQIIGPRPLLPEYLPYYSPKQRVRHLCKPGITGLSQVKGGNALCWSHRLRYDRFYVQHSGLKLDILILWLSVKYLLKKEGKVSASSLFSESFIDYSRRGNVIVSE